MPADFDVVIVGGGIHGAGVAQAAAAAGCRVLLLERTALAAGTSSRSSKLIHGGLRYLEPGHLGLVRECLRERALLLRLAPGLVRLQTFHVPIYASTRRRPCKIGLWLMAYAVLAGRSAEARFRRLRPGEWDDLDGLETRGLQAVYRYRDGQTDDRALTAAVMASARSLGAELAMPATFVRARAGDRECVIDYRCNGRSETCRATVLVNAAGPWATRVQAAIEPAPPQRAVELSQGAHIVLDAPLERGAYYVESPADGRAVFVMPFCGRTLVGTTETPFRGDPDDVAPLPQEERYLAEVADRHFPRLCATEPGAIVSSFAGLRVLPAGVGWAFARSRETILDVDDPRHPRVVAIYGGKLTAYRSTAEKVMQLISRSLPSRRPLADTRTLPLTPGTDPSGRASPAGR